MSAGDRRDQVPSRTETEQRATDNREALIDRLLDALALVAIVAVLLVLLMLLMLVGWAVNTIGGGWS